MEEIKGLLEEVIFENEENGYKVCAFDVDGDYITAKGIMPYVSPGEYMVLRGRRIENMASSLLWILMKKDCRKRPGK